MQKESLALCRNLQTDQRIRGAGSIPRLGGCCSRRRGISVEFPLSPADPHECFQGRRHYIFGHVPQMRLQFDGMQRLVLAQRLQVARIILEIALQLLAVHDLLFDLLQPCLANSDPRDRFPSVLRAITRIAVIGL